MPSRPRERESCRAPSRMPRPLSATVRSSALGVMPSRTSTWVAAAWRATLVSASWKMRNTAVARLASTAGGRYVSPRLAERLAEALTAGPPGQAHRALSPREYQVLCLLGGGKTNKQIAAAFRVGPKTISTYRSRILRKLDLKTNADLVRYVIEHDLTN